MEKRVLTILALLFIFVIVLPIALSDEDERVANAYTCLEEKVQDRCSQLTLEEQVFSLLALGYSSIASECRAEIMDNSNDDECWPESGCKLRETALVTIAFQYLGIDSSKSEAWLSRQNKTPTDLNWYLEVDTREPSVCRVYYDNSSSVQNTISINSDKKLSLTGSGNCFALANSNYWLRIDQSCLNKNFKVSCDKDFFTALLYKKASSDIWHVSSKTQSASASGTTESKVASLCFKQGGECNYEGSLWAALALQNEEGISVYLPYLIALSSSPENSKFNPDAILFLLTGSDEFISNLHANQNPAGFWDLSSPYGRYFDTALSLRALYTLTDSQADSGKEWLFSVQGDSGCWNSNSVKDTAFILYSAWPREPSQFPNAVDIDYCEDYGKYCSSQVECNDAGGEILSNFACRADALKSCCSLSVEKTCAEKSGIKCSSDEVCIGNSVSASDSNNCCVGSCEQAAEESACERAGYSCKLVCSNDEESDSDLSCDGNSLCCVPKTSGSSLWWLWLLIILIILVVLAIIFRKRIQAFWFNLRSGKGRSVSQTRPPFPPSAPRQMISRPIFPSQQPRAPVSRPKSRTDEELEATMRKLKEMSK